MAVNQTMKDRHEHNGVVVNENDTGPVSRGATQTPPQPNLPSPSINEALIDRYHPKDPQTRETIYDPIVSRMSVAVGSARLAAERAGKVANAIFANEFQTVAARHRQVKEKTHRMTQPVLAEMDAALASCKREIDMLEEKTSAPSRPQDASGYFLASEVRQRLAGMTDEEREKAIAQALADGDEPALGAISARPCFQVLPRRGMRCSVARGRSRSTAQRSSGSTGYGKPWKIRSAPAP
ncbi:MAG: hypothetical protein AAAB35_24875 [Phyllobacterium sp.]|uniref:hypothetical protein n=1 Tax=Phyllobacterium sp. TaxID=1871046 RepID=UPI0030F2E12B